MSLTVGLLRPPLGWSGQSMSRYPDELGTALDRVDGVDVVVVQPRFGTSSRTSRLTAGYGRYSLVARRSRFDVAHITDHGYAHLVYSLRGVAAVVTCHDIFPIKRQRGDLLPLRPRRVPPVSFHLSVSGLRHADAVITPTRATADDLIEHVGVDPARITVVPYGVSAAFRRFETDERKTATRRLGLPPGRSILTVDTGAPRKNQVAVLEAFARVRVHVPDAFLLHVGTPLGGQLLEAARRLRVADAIVELGLRTADEMPLFYNCASVLLFPSYYEGFGWPPLEAMACGTPVVGSRAPAVAEVVGDAGLLADANDHDALASHVRRVLESQTARATAIERGLDRAARYTWSAAAATIASLYHDVSRSRA